MTVAPNPVLIHRSRLPFRYPRRSLLRWYGPAANTSASSASANFNITSRTLPRNASLNRSGPKRPSIWLKHCILFPIGVFLLGLTLPMSQILFWDTERIRLLYFPQQAGRRRIAHPMSRNCFGRTHSSPKHAEGPYLTIGFLLTFIFSVSHQWTEIRSVRALDRDPNDGRDSAH